MCGPVCMCVCIVCMCVCLCVPVCLHAWLCIGVKEEWTWTKSHSAPNNGLSENNFYCTLPQPPLSFCIAYKMFIIFHFINSKWKMSDEIARNGYTRIGKDDIIYQNYLPHSSGRRHFSFSLDSEARAREKIPAGRCMTCVCTRA